MVSSRLLRVVIDTNVVFEGLTRSGGAAGLIIDAWHAELLCVCVSTAVAYEYTDVLSRKLSSARWRRLQPLLGSLLAQVEFVPIYYSWRPSSQDPGDDHVIDCAMNGRATIGLPIFVIFDWQTNRWESELSALSSWSKSWLVCISIFVYGENYEPINITTT
jgi:putative PIN family toxin of toxin-antitoxin system